MRALLIEKQRRLHVLQLQAARYGINTPPEIANEIADLDGKLDHRGDLLRQGEIAKIKRLITELGG